MKLHTVAIGVSIIACSNGFVVKHEPSRLQVLVDSQTKLYGGFLDGKKKPDMMKKEDDAMWIDDGSDSSGGGRSWNPFAIAKSLDDPKAKQATKPVAKKAPPPEQAKKSGGFNFPWDKKATKPVAKEAPPPEQVKKSGGFNFPWDK